MRTLLIAAALLGVASLLPSSSAVAAARWPAKPHTVARASGSVLWARGGTLYGCSTKEGLKPIPRVLGPWNGGRVTFVGGIRTAWTVRRPDGTERLWAADVSAGIQDDVLTLVPAGTPLRFTTEPDDAAICE